MATNTVSLVQSVALVNAGNALQVAAAASGMTQEEMKSCRVFFNNFDRSKIGSINGWELQIALEAMGQNPQEEDIKIIMAHLGAEKNGNLDFTQFLKAIQMQREIEKRQENEPDFLAAFIAMVSDAQQDINQIRSTEGGRLIEFAIGGGADRSGTVSSDKLRKVVKEEFALTFKIDELLEDLDTEQDGLLNYGEFKQLFS